MEWKNPVRIVYAFKEYCDRYHSNSRPIFIGDGDQTDAVKNLARQLNIEDKAFVTGFIPPQQVAECLQRADVFMILSKGEGCSLALQKL